MFEKEEIPDEDYIFYRVHKNLTDNKNEILPNVFRDKGTSMSTDWERYSSAQDTQDRGKTPTDNFILKLNVGKVRSKITLQVEHDPIDDNQAHTSVLGEKDTEARIHLMRISKIILPLSFHE
ncbi:hypothetical protein EHQ76_07495 [Leptospira barantonii]|uniref:Uncharacterized protein n=1 Tax=Leptospira barantonii TaxID=2023184 RepID=A0A5F2BH36_9LEPT|nr:hypothetical protein [Leptospira barantonii]TGM04878.1 hypothetical protein EHQ76_07495 [Leptospira barantonii]